MVMLLRVDVRRGGGASADARRGHSSPSLTATPARPVFFQYAGRTRRDSLTDLDRPRRDAASPTRPRRPRKALSGPDRCVIGVLSFQNPDNATVDDEGPPREWTRGRRDGRRGAARWARARGPRLVRRPRSTHACLPSASALRSAEPEPLRPPAAPRGGRSEERRVGKEGRSGRAPPSENKRTQGGSS